MRNDQPRPRRSPLEPRSELSRVGAGRGAGLLGGDEGRDSSRGLSYLGDGDEGCDFSRGRSAFGDEGRDSSRGRS